MHATSTTGIDALRKATAVPPVEMISTPKSLKICANDVNPVLSETDNRARLTGRFIPKPSLD
jgi:hypothetical protein